MSSTRAGKINIARLAKSIGTNEKEQTERVHID
jgi:hypothetical protein